MVQSSRDQLRQHLRLQPGQLHHQGERASTRYHPLYRTPSRKLDKNRRLSTVKSTSIVQRLLIPPQGAQQSSQQPGGEEKDGGR